MVGAVASIASMQVAWQANFLGRTAGEALSSDSTDRILFPFKYNFLKN